MKISAIICFLLVVLSCSTKEKEEASLEYTIHANYADSLRLDVNFRYKSDEEGTLILSYENNSWGDNDLFNCIKDFTVKPKPLSIDFNRDSSQIIIKTIPHQENRIQYSIAQDFESPLLNKHRYRPILDKTYFHILGMRLFMIPEGLFESESNKERISIQWGAIPGDGIFHCSFGAEKEQEIVVTQEELNASFFVGGDFRRYSFDYKGDAVYFVIRGDWKVFDDTAIFDILKETITFQNNFWKDPRKGSYSVSLIPTFEPWTATSKSYSVGGSGLPNSFISFASNNEGSTLKRISWLYNHELLHKWIGRTIKNENEVEQYWFSEGFTDYYAYKLMLKNDKLTAEEFISTINDIVIIPHYKDTINSIPNSEMTFERYWSNYGVYQKLPYRRGLLYAFMLDTQIKERSQFSKSLDDLMQDLLAMSLEDENMRLNHVVFQELLTSYLDDHALVEFERYILNGQLIDFKGKLPNGLSLDIQDAIPLFKIEAGIDTALLENRLKL